MAQQAAADTESQDRLRDLQTIIKEVYLPTLETKAPQGDIKHNILKFTNQINNALTQAYGNVTIYVPPITASDEEIQRNPKMLKSFNDAVEDWTKKIRETLEKEEKKAAQRSYLTAQGETEFWSNRSATFNTLHQQLQMPAVRKILQLLGHKDNQYDNILDQYSTAHKEFQKRQAQAKDFVKFLQTLERQFKVISKGELKAITETMRSLLDGLKLIWTISRHINHHIEQFEHILEAITNEVCQKVRNKIDIRTIFTKKRPADAIADIGAGIQVLDRW
jgi:dynein heavy chain